MATALIVIPLVPARAPETRAPLNVIPLELTSAFAGVADVAHWWHVLSREIYPGTVIAGTEIEAPLVLTR